MKIRRESDAPSDSDPVKIRGRESDAPSDPDPVKIRGRESDAPSDPDPVKIRGRESDAPSDDPPSDSDPVMIRRSRPRQTPSRWRSPNGFAAGEPPTAAGVREGGPALACLS